MSCDFIKLQVMVGYLGRLNEKKVSRMDENP